MHHVPVLYCRPDSVYKRIEGCDVWDRERNALQWPGGCPLIAHPPCRTWGRLRHFAKAPPDEASLALWAVAQIQRWGGILEHPAASRLWSAASLPRPGTADAYGWTLGIDQYWFGHRAQKRTLLYIVGLSPADMLPLPYQLGEPSPVVQSMKRVGSRPHISKREREATPLRFARWLVGNVQRIAPSRVTMGRQ